MVWQADIQGSEAVPAGWGDRFGLRFWQPPLSAPLFVRCVWLYVMIELLLYAYLHIWHEWLKCSLKAGDGKRCLWSGSHPVKKLLHPIHQPPSPDPSFFRAAIRPSIPAEPNFSAVPESNALLIRIRANCRGEQSPVTKKKLQDFPRLMLHLA